jgi:hypothetical protein
VGGRRRGRGAPRALIGGLALVAAAGTGCAAAETPSEEPVASAALALAVTLQNGWTNAPYSTRNAGVYVDPGSGIVHFSGAVAGGTAQALFTLPTGYRPGVTTYVPVDLCSAANGRLIIGTDGVVSVQAQSAFSDAQCFTSLEGASFAPTSAGFTGLTLQNGWTAYGSGTTPLYGVLGGAVRFKGAIANGTTGVAFTLPSGARPSTDVYVPVDLCSATNGRLHIQPSGAVTVQSEGSFSNAQCFTSLDGAWFVPSSTSSFLPLNLQNGWTNAPFSTTAAVAENVGGIVHFKGAIAGGTAAAAFTLPSGFWPTSDVYVPVDLCSATKGRLYIQPTGQVSVQAEYGTFSNAQCFTSLEGASYSIEGFNPPADPFPVPFPPMASHGGAPLSKLQLQTITFAGDPITSAAQSFGAFIVGSSWLQSITQSYRSGGPYVATNANGVVPAYTSGQVDVQALLEASFANGVLTLPSDTTGLLYQVYVPAAGCSNTSYHGFYNHGSTTLAYSVICGYNGASSNAAVMSHEIGEAITDPYGHGYWFDQSNGPWQDENTVLMGFLESEVADVCNLPVYESGWTLGGIWSPASAAAGHSPCVPFPSTAVYVNVSPSAPGVPWTAWSTQPIVIAKGGQAQVTLTGWTSPASSDTWSVIPELHAANPFSLTAQVSSSTLSANNTVTLTLGVPLNATSGQLAYVDVLSVIFGADGAGSGYWPFVVKVQ